MRDINDDCDAIDVVLVVVVNMESYMRCGRCNVSLFDYLTAYAVRKRDSTRKFT